MLRRRLLSIAPLAVLLAALPIAASAVEVKVSPPGLVMLEDLGEIVRWEAVVDGHPLRITTRMFDGCLWSCYPTVDGCWVSPCWAEAATHEEAAERGVELAVGVLRDPAFVDADPVFGSVEFDELLDGWQSVFVNAPSTRDLFYRRGIAEELRKRNPVMADNLRKSIERAGGRRLTATRGR